MVSTVINTQRSLALDSSIAFAFDSRFQRFSAIESVQLLID